MQSRSQLLPILTTLVAWPVAGPAQTLLVERGTSRFVIVAGASEGYRFAAGELCRYVETITGASPAILSPADLQDLESFLKPDYNPDRDFLPPGLAPSLRSRQGE